MGKQTINRRKFLTMSALAAGGALAASCAQPQPEPEVIEKEVVKEVEKVVTATPGATGKVEVSFWSELVGSKEEGRAALLSAFNAASDDIEVVHEPTFGSEETQQKFLTAATGGVVPDLLGNETDFLPGYVEIEALTDLGPYLEASESLKESSFPPGVISQCKYDGRVWGIPVYADTLVLYYNKDLFEAAGLDPESPPRDWPSLREAAMAIAKRDSSGKLEVSGCGISSYSAPRAFLPLLYAYGGKLYNDDLTKVAFNGPEGKEVLRLMADLILKDRATDLGWGDEFEDSTSEPFIAGKMGMVFEVPAATVRINRWRPEFKNWGITGIPGGPNGFAQVVTTCALMIPSAAKHKDEAWRVIEYWMQPKVMVRWSKDVSRPPSTIAAMEDEAVVGDPYIAPIAEALQHTVEIPQHPRYGEIFSALSAEIELALIGQKEPEQALDDAAAQADQILARPS